MSDESRFMSKFWDIQFTELFSKAVAEYTSGNSDFESYYTKSDKEFLSSIGYKERELFDFVEDFVDDSAPSLSTALLVAGVRRDYFLVAQDGVASSHEISRNELPTFGDELAGIAYLPRIIVKAKAKLKGELDPDIMFGCGGDRKFLRQHGNIHPADFLRHVWASDGNDEKVAEFVKAHSE